MRETACGMLIEDSCFVCRVDNVYVVQVKSLKASTFYVQGKDSCLEPWRTGGGKALMGSVCVARPLGFTHLAGSQMLPVGVTVFFIILFGNFVFLCSQEKSKCTSLFIITMNIGVFVL